MSPGDRIRVFRMRGSDMHGVVTCTTGDYFGEPVIDFIDDEDGRERWAFATCCRPDTEAGITARTALSAVNLLEGVTEAREHTARGRMSAALAITATAIVGGGE